MPSKDAVLQFRNALIRFRKKLTKTMLFFTRRISSLMILKQTLNLLIRTSKQAAARLQITTVRQILCASRLRLLKMNVLNFRKNWLQLQKTLFLCLMQSLRMQAFPKVHFALLKKNLNRTLQSLRFTLMVEKIFSLTRQQKNSMQMKLQKQLQNRLKPLKKPAARWKLLKPLSKNIRMLLQPSLQSSFLQKVS